MAQTLASMSYNAIQNYALRRILEIDFAAKRLSTLPEVAQNTIWMMCHVLSGLSHTLPKRFGPFGGYVATIMAGLFTELAKQVGQRTGQPVTIEMTPDSWRVDPDSSQIFDPEVQAKAARYLTERLEKDCEGTGAKNSKKSDTVSFLSRLGIGIGDFCKKERRGITESLKKATKNIAAKREQIRKPVL